MTTLKIKIARKVIAMVARNRKRLVPEAEKALDKFKMEIAAELG